MESERRTESIIDTDLPFVTPFDVSKKSDNHGMPDVFVHKLKVKDAEVNDIGLNIARIDSSSLILMGLEIGDFVVLTGKTGHKAAARCLDSIMLEIEPTIRIDQVVRYNLGVNIDETITQESVRKVRTSPTSSGCQIVLEALVSSVPSMIDELYLLQSLQGMPVIRGQVVLVPYFGGKWYPYAAVNTEAKGADGEVFLIGPDTGLILSR